MFGAAVINIQISYFLLFILRFSRARLCARASCPDTPPSLVFSNTMDVDATTTSEEVELLQSSKLVGLLDPLVHQQLMYEYYLYTDAHVQTLKVDKIRDAYREAKKYPEDIVHDVYLPKCGVTMGQLCFFKVVHSAEARSNRVVKPGAAAAPASAFGAVHK